MEVSVARVNVREPLRPVILHKRYRINHKISRGDSSRVYEGTDLPRNEKVAIKLSLPLEVSLRLLEVDAAVQEAVMKSRRSVYPLGVPQVRWHGESGYRQAIVSDLLGPSLEDLFNLCGRKFSLKTVLLVADQLLARLQNIHRCHYVHYNIKPEHFIMGIGEEENVLHVVGFGASVKFEFDMEYDSEHEARVAKIFETSKANDDKALVARDAIPTLQSRRDALLFASIDSHMGKRPTFGDDIESLGYMLIYLFNGSLPWEDVEAPTDAELSQQIMKKKMEMPLDELCKGLPEEFGDYMDYAQCLGYAESPDYKGDRYAFRKLYEQLGYKDDGVFDWTEKLTQHTQG